MLREALRSVAAQTVRDRIAQVLVSENAGSTDSAQVCAEFGGLPIQYVRREPPLDRLDHARAIFCTEAGPAKYTAILHDDDWWAPDHLARSLDWLDAHPAGTAWTCCAFSIIGATPEMGCDDNLLPWFGAGFPPVDQTWALDLTGVTLANLAETTVRYSTLVTRTAALVRAGGVVFGMGNPFDNDRLLAFELARQGPVGYRPLPSAFIRVHPAQNVNDFDRETMRRHRRSSTAHLVGECARLGIDLRAALAARLAQCPAETKSKYIERFRRPEWAEVLAEHKLQPAGHDASPAPAHSKLKAGLKQLLPPLALKAGQRLRQPRP
jgi:hypothetical protein